MKFTFSALKKHLITDLSALEIAETLTRIGAEVESLTSRDSSEFQNIVIAEIISTEPHPSADRLRICLVNDGNTKNLQIVCGASNARAGIKVALAQIGANLPNLTIQKTTIRGIESNGMLCSESELGLADAGLDGIMELAEDAPVSSGLADYLELCDPVFEIKITPNRADLLGVRGIARDLAVAGAGKLLPSMKLKSYPLSDAIKISLNTPKIHQFRGIILKNIQNRKSPIWLKNYITNNGMKPISAVVDVTNYIMHQFARPLHAYDLSKILDNELIFRMAKQDEPFISLSSKEPYKMTGDELVASDKSGTIHSLAGVIGGATSAIQESSSEILLEAADFTQEQVAINGRRHNINSDARYRFERCVDPLFLSDGLAIAAEMIIEICGGTAYRVQNYGEPCNLNSSIDFNLANFAKIIGFAIESVEARKILTDLGCTVNEDFTKIITPSHRGDLKISADIIEELIRIKGYDNIPLEPLNLQKNSCDTGHLTILRKKLATSGFSEMISWSFTDSKRLELFGFEQRDEQKLINPISQELNYMRPSAILNIIPAIAKNNARQITSGAWFEIGSNWPHGITQENHLTLVKFGRKIEGDWRLPATDYSFFDLKYDLYRILEHFGLGDGAIELTGSAPNYYHPQASAGILFAKKQSLGFIGTIHPSISSHFDLSMPIFIAELYLNKISFIKKKKQLAEINDFQAIYRDFAFIVQKDVRAGDLLKTVKLTDKSLIQDVLLFDLFESDKIGANKKSIAINIKIQPIAKPMTGFEIEQLSNKIISEVVKRYNAELRDH